MKEIILQVATITAIYALVTLSLNLQFGLTGLVNFGQAMLFAIGGFVVAAGHLHGWPVWVGPVAAPFAGALAGWLISIPARRLGDTFWGLLTLGVSELFLAVMTNETSIAGGSNGVPGIPRLDTRILLPALIVFIAVVVVALERIRRSQFGRIIRVSREDPLLVRASGRDVSHFWVIVTMVGGALAAIAGAAFAHYFTYISPDSFALSTTLDIWTMMIIGGLANNYGVIAGSVLLQGLFAGSRFIPVLSSIPPQAWGVLRAVITGLALVFVLVFRQQGLFPERKVRYAAEDR
jgi:branched-chain amino acid transport system permease protein